MSKDGWLPPGVTDADIDRATPDDFPSADDVRHMRLAAEVIELLDHHKLSAAAMLAVLELAQTVCEEYAKLGRRT